MCGIAGYLGKNKEAAALFSERSRTLLQHRGPDDSGIYEDDHVALTQTRLSILELSALGHQPMYSSCGRYVTVFNGEIYNHLELRKRFLPNYQFRGHSDTETLVELFRIQREQMLKEMVGMWSLLIWDKQEQQLFVSRSRLGQKPLYMRRKGDAWMLASEVRPLLGENERTEYDTTAVVEYLALGNYGHLGEHTFFRDVRSFPEGSYAWVRSGAADINFVRYWELPDVAPKDKIPFDKSACNKLHDLVVEAVLSVTLSDVPIGLTLSGGVDSSIIAGILASYYDKDIHVFTAQSPNSKFDETRYVDAVINKYPGSNMIVHRKNLNEVSVKDSLEQYIRIQEEPFGDPSIIAHGFLMDIASSTGIKVILNGQGADELFHGYNNMAQAILSYQFRSVQLNRFRKNLNEMKLGTGYTMRTMLKTFFPSLEFYLRKQSRLSRREIIEPSLLKNVQNDLVQLYKYDNIYNVWRESLHGVHLPHLVHYDDRNAMAKSIEGRMPFLDHRIVDFVASVRPDDLLKKGMRKFILRESCKQYIPGIVYERKDKIGFYTPLISMLEKDKEWVAGKLKANHILTEKCVNDLSGKLGARKLNVNEALQIWRSMSVSIWKKEFNINSQS